MELHEISESRHNTCGVVGFVLVDVQWRQWPIHGHRRHCRRCRRCDMVHVPSWAAGEYRIVAHHCYCASGPSLIFNMRRVPIPAPASPSECVIWKPIGEMRTPFATAYLEGSRHLRPPCATRSWPAPRSPYSQEGQSERSPQFRR